MRIFLSLKFSSFRYTSSFSLQFFLLVTIRFFSLYFFLFIIIFPFVTIPSHWGFPSPSSYCYTFSFSLQLFFRDNSLLFVVVLSCRCNSSFSLYTFSFSLLIPFCVRTSSFSYNFCLFVRSLPSRHTFPVCGSSSFPLQRFPSLQLSLFVTASSCFFYSLELSLTLFVAFPFFVSALPHIGAFLFRCNSSFSVQLFLSFCYRTSFSFELSLFVASLPVDPVDPVDPVEQDAQLVGMPS